MISTKELVKNALGLIKKGASLNWNVDKDVVSIYSHALKGFSTNDIMVVCKDLAISWRNRFPPQPGVIKELCQLRIKDSGDRKKEERHLEEKAWMTRKFRHRHALKDVVDRLRSGALTNDQSNKISIVSAYMAPLWGDDWIGDIEYRDEKERLSPVTASFVGLYMDVLEETLKPLTGNKQGNLTFGLGG
jgi:hypothetical protein